MIHNSYTRPHLESECCAFSWVPTPPEPLIAHPLVDLMVMSPLQSYGTLASSYAP